MLLYKVTLLTEISVNQTGFSELILNLINRLRFFLHFTCEKLKFKKYVNACFMLKPLKYAKICILKLVLISS